MTCGCTLESERQNKSTSWKSAGLTEPTRSFHSRELIACLRLWMAKAHRANNQGEISTHDRSHGNGYTCFGQFFHCATKESRRACAARPRNRKDVAGNWDAHTERRIL